MVGLLSQLFRGMTTAWQRVAGAGTGTAGTCRCGWPLEYVEGRGWCRRCGFPPSKPEAGWPLLCPGCRFPLNPSENGTLFCPHCKWQSEYPMGRRPPLQGGKRKLRTIGA